MQPTALAIQPGVAFHRRHGREKPRFSSAWPFFRCFADGASSTVSDMSHIGIIPLIQKNAPQI